MLFVFCSLEGVPFSQHQDRWKKLHLPDTKEEAQRLLLMADMHGKGLFTLSEREYRNDFPFGWELELYSHFMRAKIKRKLLPPANEVWGKVMFLHLSVSHLLTGGCIPACTGADTPPYPSMGRHIPACTGQTPPGRRLLLWMVGILPECIRVGFFCVRFLSV